MWVTAGRCTVDLTLASGDTSLHLFASAACDDDSDADNKGTGREDLFPVSGHNQQYRTPNLGRYAIRLVISPPLTQQIGNNCTNALPAARL
jgi:hypothetical protein